MTGDSRSQPKISRPATVIISDWLANCQVGQWTPFEAATALKSALAKEGYSVARTEYVDDLEARHATLKARMEELEAALRPFADIAQFVTETQRDTRPINFGMDQVLLQRLTIGHLRAARAALEAKPAGGTGE